MLLFWFGNGVGLLLVLVVCWMWFCDWLIITVVCCGFNDLWLLLVCCLLFDVAVWLCLLVDFVMLAMFCFVCLFVAYCDCYCCFACFNVLCIL